MPPSYLNCWDFEKNWWINKGGSYLPRSYLNCCPKLSPLQKQKKNTLKKQEFSGLSGPLTPLTCAQLSPVFSYIWKYYLRRTLGWFLCLFRITPPFSYSGTILDSLKNLNFCYLFHLNIIWVLYYRKA